MPGAVASKGGVTRRIAKETLTPVEMNHGDALDFRLVSGENVRMELVSTSARVVRTTLKQLKIEENAAKTLYRFHCVVRVNGAEHRLEREIPSQRSFNDPWVISGLWIWFDAVDATFDFLVEEHGECRPKKHARFGVQDASLRICPGLLHPWCPLPEGGLKIEQCYRGEDRWMGPYNGASAHGGLDINHPRGTPLWAPIDIHDHFYFNSLAMGHNNNRWRGIHRWPDGSEWILQAHHMTELTVPEHHPLKKGDQFAWGAGVLSGAVDHSHFVFKIREGDDTIALDPWILFRQMYLDRDTTKP